jgi:hypothetical protein
MTEKIKKRQYISLPGAAEVFILSKATGITIASITITRIIRTIKTMHNVLAVARRLNITHYSKKKLFPV